MRDEGKPELVVVYHLHHLHGQTGRFTVWANDKQISVLGKFRLGLALTICEISPIYEKIGNLSNHDGNAKEKVTLKMTSKYFKLVHDSFNSFNLSNVAEQSGS